MRKFKIKLSRTAFILTLLLICGLFLRVVNIDNIPKAIYGDGLTAVYDAYSILKTGHDQKGNFLPFVFQLGDHRPPLYVYATVPFVAIFGPSALSANAVSILSGLGLITLIFFLGKKLYSDRVGIFAAFLIDFSSWDIDLSRGPFETHLALFLATLAVYALLKTKNNPNFLILASLGFGLSSLTYPTYVLTAPLLLLFLLFLTKNKKEFLREHRLVSLLAALISASAIILSFQIIHSGSGPTRAESINVFNQPEIKDKIIKEVNFDRSFDTSPEIVKNLLHNKFIAYTLLIVDNYLDNFRPNFLLLKGDREPRNNPDEMGELNITSGVLMSLGIVFLFGQRNLIYLLGWLLIAPIATSLISPPHSLRNSLMLPPLILLAAFGAEKLISTQYKFKKIIIGCFVIFYLIETVYFLERFYFISPNKFSRFWSYPAKQATFLALANKSKYDYIIMSQRIDNMEFAYPVYAKVDPKEVIRQNQQGTQLSGKRFLNYENVYIGSLYISQIRAFINSVPGSVLYIGDVQEKDGLESPKILDGADFLPSLVFQRKQ